MKIFIDSANVSEIKEAYATGLIDGVTTNPTLIMKSGKQPETVYQQLKDLGISDISMEVVGDAENMINEGRRLKAKFGDCTTIKVPCTPDGLLACHTLSKELIRVNVTLIFSTAQAILAAKAGAAYVSPFVGRLEDNSHSGVEVTRSIVDVYKKHGIYTEVLAASIRDVAKVTLAFWNGAQICTIPPKVFHKMYNHVLTDAGLKIFDEDHKATFSTGRVGGDLDQLDGLSYNFTDDGFTYMIDTPETQGTVDFSGVDEYPDYKSQEYRPD
jgi:transaldolase